MASSIRRRAVPRTYVGRWLRAAMLGQQELRDQLIATLNGGAPGWNDDEPVVVKIACELVARRYFGASPDDCEITDAARMLCEATADASTSVTPHQADAVLKSALHEPGADGAMTRGELFLFRTYALGFMSLKLRLGELAIDELLREAERLAFEQGSHPQLAPRGGPGGAPVK